MAERKYIMVIKNMSFGRVMFQCMCISHLLYFSAIKKNEILPFGTTWISLEDIVLSEVSQTERDKHCMFSLICGI